MHQLGSIHDAGWHCSWCLEMGELQQKIKSGPCGDGTRWGAWEWNKETLRWLRRNGMFFGDGPTSRIQTVPIEVIGPERFAPPYVIENSDRFGYLLFPENDKRLDNFKYRPPYCDPPIPDKDYQNDESSATIRNLRREWCQQ